MDEINSAVRAQDISAVRAQDIITPESVARMVKDSVDRGEPNRELSTAGKYLLLAAMNICAETVRNFSGYLEHAQSDEAEYWALDAKRTMSQTRRVLDVLAEIEGLDMP